MKRLALLMLSVFLLIQTPAWAEAGKIAVVDVSRAIKLSDGGKKASEVLMEKKASTQVAPKVRPPSKTPKPRFTIE